MSINNPNVSDEIMCTCSGTKRSEISLLFKRGMDVEAISRWTGALSGCGGCESDISNFLKSLSAQDDNISPN